MTQFRPQAVRLYVLYVLHINHDINEGAWKFKVVLLYALFRCVIVFMQMPRAAGHRFNSRVSFAGLDYN